MGRSSSLSLRAKSPPAKGFTFARIDVFPGAIREMGVPNIVTVESFDGNHAFGSSPPPATPIPAMKTFIFTFACVALLRAAPAATPAAAIQNALQAIDAEIKADQYDIARTDLDGDGTADVLALMNGKSGYCGSGGCTLFILRDRAGGLTKVAAVKIVNRPVYLRKTSHHGWRDLLVAVRGGGATPGLASLAFDGTTYPVAPGEAGAEKQDGDTVLFADTAAAFEATQSLQGITFKVTSTGDTVTITPSGLGKDNSPVNAEVQGRVKRAEVADINADGSPEIYVFAAETGGDLRGSLIAYSANNKNSLSRIHLPPLEDDAKNARGYRGRDEFAVVENILARRFPIYPDDAAKTGPTGKLRQLQYKLHTGEAGWVLKLDRVVEF